MEWLKDKKNLPIVATIASVLVIVIAFVLWTVVFKGPSDEETAGAEGVPAETTATIPPMPQNPEVPASTAAPTTPTAPAADSATPAASGQVAVVPMESWRKDPFMPLNYKPPTRGKVKARPPIVDLPLGALFPPRMRKSAAIAIPEPPQPPRRMAGLLLNGRIFAIIESNGKSEIVQPGDTLSDRLAVVEKIERDRVILKTTSEHPRYIVVRMAAAVSPRGSTSPTTSMPGGPNMQVVPRSGPGRYGNPSGPMQGT